MHASIWHHYGDMVPQIYSGHDLDLLESRDVISYVTIRLPGLDFLSMVHSNHVSI